MGPKGPRDCGEKHSEGQCMEKCQGHFLFSPVTRHPEQIITLGSERFPAMKVWTQTELSKDPFRSVVVDQWIMAQNLIARLF